MQIELDHLFVCTNPGAPEAEKLVRFGLHEGPPNQHPGQGTANCRFVFANAMIELLWVSRCKLLDGQNNSEKCHGPAIPDHLSKKQTVRPQLFFAQIIVSGLSPMCQAAHWSGNLQRTESLNDLVAANQEVGGSDQLAPMNLIPITSAD